MAGGGKCPYVLGFGQQIPPRTSAESNDLGEAKARIHPLIHQKTDSSFSILARAYFFLNENALSSSRGKEYMDSSHLECQGCN